MPIYSLVYLRKKDEAEDTFMTKIDLEKQLDRKIKMLKYNRDGEFGSNMLTNFVKDME